MALSPLDLPLEILLTVVDQLASEHLPSLPAFSLANKFCCRISSRQRFRNIHFEVFAENRLLVDIKHWESVLGKNQAYAFVQRLSVHGSTPSAKYNDPALVRDPDLPHQHQRSFPGDEEWTDLKARYSNVLNPSPKVVELVEMEAWRPLSEFIRRLSGLKDLLWAAWAQFPPCLLEVLHQDLPHCRLHLRASTLNNLYSTADLPREINNIRNAKMYTERAITWMAGGLAPNLTQLYIQYPNARPIVYHPDEQGPPPGDLFTENGHTLSRLQSLSWVNIPPESIGTWDERIPFSNLTTLEVQVDHTMASLSKVAQYEFPSLRSLCLRIQPTAKIQDRYGTDSHFYNTVTAFLLAFPPVARLLIIGPLTLDSITNALRHHGRCLRTIGLLLSDHLHDIPSSVTIMKMSKDINTHCKKLRILTLQIPRFQGNQQEVDMYRALGEIPTLSRLTLELDCTPSDANPRSVLVNIAVDAFLVRQIFSAIAGSSSASLLQCLRIEVIMNIKIGDIEVFYELMRETIWEVFCWTDGVSLHGSLRDKRNSWRAKVPKRTDWMADVPCEKEFRELQPSKGRFWMEDWHSFLLQLE